jgi:very-short-patch-repair endonuclease
MPSSRRIVRGQRVSHVLWQSARNLKQEMTAAEKLLWTHLRGNQLHGFHFRRQQIIGSYIVDFYCHTCKLVIEVDGDIHELQMEQDAIRDTHLTEMGFRVVRFRNDEILGEIPCVLARILEACESAMTGQSTAPPSFLGKGAGGLGRRDD